MINLNIQRTQTYSGLITIDNEHVKTMSQNFNEDGLMDGLMGDFIVNKELYYANLVECRKQEDAFKMEMRKIEDERVANENETTK